MIKVAIIEDNDQFRNSPGNNCDQEKDTTLSGFIYQCRKSINWIRCNHLLILRLLILVYRD